MPRDVYDPCPCGSGKKLKFCCYELVGDMDRVLKLIENDQSRMALQQLDQLSAGHPNNPWLVTTRATILIDEDRDLEAKELLEALLEESPEHGLALGLYAMASLTSDGLERARPAIYRAFQRGLRTCPEIVGRLLISIAAEMHGARRYLAARQHLVLAMQLVPEEIRREVFLQLLDLDGDASIPYPLRSVHQPVTESGDDATADESAKALSFAAIGCFGPAATLYQQAAEKQTDNPHLWYNVGMCRAWEGNEQAAAQALHRAAKLYDDYETAIECETIAQLLDHSNSENAVYVRTAEHRVKSVSKLLTLLDEHERIPRLDFPQDDADDSGLAAVYEIVDRPVQAKFAIGEPVEGQFATALAQLTIYDQSDEDEYERGPIANVMGIEGENLDAACRLFVEVAGDELENTETEDSPEPIVHVMPRELIDLSWQAYLPPNTPALLRKTLQRDRWNQGVNEVWPKTPLAALGGKTPEQAAEDADLQIPLAAAFYVLDAFCCVGHYSLDLDSLFDRFGLKRPAPVDVTQDTSLNSFSAMKLHRLPVGELSDAQLTNLVNRSVLVRHDRYLRKLLQEVVERPAVAEEIGHERVFSTLVELCVADNQYDEAFDWIERGKEFAASQENAFDNVLQWTIRELAIRLHNPSDPGLATLLKHIGSYYGPKLPRLIEEVTELVAPYGIPLPWDASGVVAASGAEASQESAGGLWTPSAPPPPHDDQSKKLWIPGQS